MSEIILEFFAELPKELYVFVVSLFPIIELRGAIPLGAGLGMPFYTNYLCSVIGNLIPVPFILLFISKMLDFLTRFKLTRPVVEWLRRKADKHSSKVLVEEQSPVTAADEKSVTDTFDLISENDDSNEENCAASEDGAPKGYAEDKCAASDEDFTAVHVSEESASSEESVSTVDYDSAVTDEAFKGNSKSVQRTMRAPVFWALALLVAIPLPGTGAWTGALVAALFNLPKRKSFIAVTLGVLIAGVIMCLASYGVVGFLKIFT